MNKEGAMNRFAVVTTVALLALGLGPVGANALSTEDAITNQEQIRGILDRYEAALNASDVDAVLALYAADGVFMPTNAPTAAGTPAVRAAYEHVFDTIKLDIAFSIDEIVVDDHVAFATTGSKGQVTILTEQVTAPEENRELFVFQKIDGLWKIARYMFNKASAPGIGTEGPSQP